MRQRVTLGALLAVSICSSPSAAQQPVARYPVPAERYTHRVERSILITARDGVKLATDLYFPVGAPEPLPVILIRTPYNKRSGGSSVLRFVQQGYVVAIQDVRGKYESAGDFTLSGSDRLDGRRGDAHGALKTSW